MNKRMKKQVCPYKSVNFLSKASVWWLTPYFQRGFKKKFQTSDLFPIASNDQADFVTTRLCSNWDDERERAKKYSQKPSFLWAFWKTYLWGFFLNAFPCVLGEFFRILSPFFIGELSYYFVNPSEVSTWYPYFCAFGLSFSSFLYILVDNYALMGIQGLGWNAKTAVVGLMYRKTLKLNHKALSQTTNGKIVNLSSTDALRIYMAFACTHYLWIVPLECVILTYFLWLQLDTAGVVGMALMFFIMALQTLLGKCFGRLRLKTAHATDERVHVTNEVIAGMRIIKMYSWEKSFKQILSDLRKKEMGHILHASLLRSFNYTTKHSTIQILSFVTFVVFTAMHGTLNLQLVLVSLGLFSVLLLGAGLVFPFAVETFFQTLAVLKRVEEFLLLPELDPVTKSRHTDPGIDLVDFSAFWTETGKPTLQDISVKVGKGGLLMVVGPVGAGKSSLLSAILGELPATSGKAEVSGKIAYSSQIPWLFSDSIRNNILFGEDFDAEKYEEVVRACALEQDFSILPSGDHTLVGERGVTLSGGQKARVSLARLAYRSDTDIAIMDDPLSAVDPSVADHLFQNCICDLLKSKIRMLVTHQVQFLDKADHILILKEGRIIDQGNFSDLKKKGTDFVSLMKVVSDDVDDDVMCNHNRAYETQFSINSNESFCHENEKMKEGENDEDLKISFSNANESLLNLEEDRKKNEDESSASGSIPFKVYSKYFNSGLPLIFFIVLVLASVGSHSLIILLDWWLAQWALASQDHINNQNQSVFNLSLSRDNTTESPINASVHPVTVTSFDQTHYLYVYAMMMIGYFFLMYMRTAMHYYLCVQSSVALHTKMLASVLRTKIRFFDTNPIGAVLNRFSKDMSQVDEMLPLTLLEVFFNGGAVLAVMIFVVSVNYFVIIMIVPMVIYLVWIRKFFITTSREVKRIEAQERSPVFSHLSATLQGLITIRTFQAQDDFISAYDRLQDKHGCAWCFHFFSQRWFGYRLDLITSAFIGACAFLSVVFLSVLPDDWPINPGNLGLTLTYSTSLIIWFQWGVRQSAEAENMMTSVERIQEYHKLPEEESSDEDKTPPRDWPVKGDIKFTNLSYRYYDGGPEVLKKMSLEIKEKEKLGIVGRTGAGKSSLVAALFRMTDYMSGLIVIGGLDFKQVSLEGWRKVLTIIPQDPVLFGGTMRRNLDPFSVYTDQELWSALEKVQLKNVVENFPLKLECVLTESGSNLSVGQRQLVCLARAILRNNKILIIDEATANVDTRTDRLIQETIRKEFSHCTVLTIAHRLDTIIDSDRILVLSDGEITECDEPHKLLRNKDGVLTEMVKMTGSREVELRKAAKKAYVQRRIKQTKETSTLENGNVVKA